jgi:hypothetical protein
LGILVLCDCRDYIVASRGLRLLRADFAGPFSGAQFLGVSISEDACALKVSLGINMFLLPLFESIASIRNLRRSDDGGNTYQDSGVLTRESLM